jgi:glycerophosphoryl diester phosphodiesterase
MKFNLLSQTAAAAVLAVSACASTPANEARAFDLPARLQRTVALAHEPANPYVLIEAHRAVAGPGRPENSIPSIERAIEVGADWVEIDVALTKDGQLVLMHDRTLNRTTTLTGPVGDVTLAQLTEARLRDPEGAVTDLRVPTLEQALDAMAGRMLFRLDLKCGDACEERVYDMVLAKGLMDQAVIGASLRDRALATGLTDDQIIVVGDRIEQIGTVEKLPAFVDYIQVKDFDAAKPPLDLMAAFAPHVRMTAYPYDDKRAGGHGDVRSKTDPADGWGWLVQSGADVLLTDETEAVLAYLQSKGYRKR